MIVRLTNSRHNIFTRLKLYDGEIMRSMPNAHLTINSKQIGPRNPVYIIAEMSANHNGSFDRAVQIIQAAKNANADAIKLQTYTPDTMTINCDNPHFKINGTPWAGRTLYDLYTEAYTPWEWQPKLKQIAESEGLDFFSTPFDSSAVDFLESMKVPAYKIASFENVDLPLITTIAKTGRPIILSTGMATLSEIEEAVRTFTQSGGKQIALLKCTSAYPAAPEEINLKTIPHLMDTFGLPVGLSDHTTGIAIAAAAVALGACIIEKHLTIARSDKGPDSAFSLEPDEFKEMVSSVRVVEKALGSICYDVGSRETQSKAFRRSIFAVRDIHEGEPFTHENVAVIRPGVGLHTRYLSQIIGRSAKVFIPRGTPIRWEHL